MGAELCCILALHMARLCGLLRAWLTLRTCWRESGPRAAWKVKSREAGMPLRE